MTTLIHELKAIHCGQKSFYHKAQVIETYDEDKHETKRLQLQSYTTIVVDVTLDSDAGESLIIIENMHSKTTKRHIKDFIIQYYGVNAWAVIEKDYNSGVTEWVL